MSEPNRLSDHVDDTAAHPGHYSAAFHAANGHDGLGDATAEAVAAMQAGHQAEQHRRGAYEAHSRPAGGSGGEPVEAADAGPLGQMPDGQNRGSTP